MTFQILTLVLNWAETSAASQKISKEYREALIELSTAIKRVVKFN